MNHWHNSQPTHLSLVEALVIYGLLAAFVISLIAYMIHYA